METETRDRNETNRKSDRFRMFAEKVCYRLTQLIRKVRKRKSWNGPTCTCKSFKDRGKCKHLDMFREMVLSAEGDIGGSVDHFTSKKKKHLASKPQQPSDDGSKYVLATSKYALSNDSEHSIRNIVVPKAVKRLSRDLVLLDIIGKGGCGRLIYRATAEDYGVVLAKVLHCEPPACLPHHQLVMNNELDILSKLKPHPNVLTFFGYTETLLESTTLERRVAFEFAVDSLSDLVQHRCTAHLRLTFLEIRNYAIDVLSAIEYLHSLGIVHRDLSSQNVMMTVNPYPSSSQWSEVMKRHFRLSNSLKNAAVITSPVGETFRIVPKKSKSIGWRSRSNPPNLQPQVLAPLNENASMGPTMTAKIGNFEVAKQIHAMRTMTRVSSPTCMPPEMWRAEAYDFSVDIWAVGVLMHEMLSKDRPLGKLNLSQIESMVTTKSFPMRSNIAPVEYKALEGIMRKCLAFEPAQRPSAVDLLHELRQSLV